MAGSVDFTSRSIWLKSAENRRITFGKWEPQDYIQQVRTAGLHSASENRRITFGKWEPQDYIRQVRTAWLHSASENRRITFGKWGAYHNWLTHSIARPLMPQWLMGSAQNLLVPAFILASELLITKSRHIPVESVSWTALAASCQDYWLWSKLRLCIWTILG